MVDRQSRYAQTRPFREHAAGAVPFAGMRPRLIRTPDGVIEHLVKAWERTDGLSFEYFGDDRRWWRILDANPDILFAGDVVTDGSSGSSIIIPRTGERGAA